MARAVLSLAQGLLPMLCIFLALTRAVCAAVLSGNHQVAHRSSLAHDGKAVGLRGGLHTSRHGAGPLVTLQTSARTHKARSTSKLARMTRRQQRMTRRELKFQVELCRGRKLIWWIKVKNKCQKSYGRDSKWDRSKMDGQCRSAWNTCNTGFYAVCCSQPSGPKTMHAYCEKKQLEEEEGKQKAKSDKACEVQGKMSTVSKQMKAITQTVQLMDKKDDEQKVVTGTLAKPKPTSDVSGAPSPGPAVPKNAATTDGIMAAGGAPAPAGALATSESMSARCAQLVELTKKAALGIHDIRKWAIKDGVRGVGDDDKENKEAETKKDPEESDPDLVLSVKDVLKIGKKLDALVAQNKFCTKQAKEKEEEVDDDTDDNDKDVDDDLTKDPTAAWKDGEDEDDDDEHVTKTRVVTRYVEVESNTTAIVELLEFDSELKKKTDDFETEIHPHGMKWWRYRYEYTILESFVLAYSVMLLYVIKFLMFGLSFFRVHKFYRTGRPVKFFRYSFIYFVFHAACVCIMVFFAYMLYVPWGTYNPFDYFAKAFHDFVDGTFNAPYLGYSWLYLILDIQFQLFATFTLYAIFTALVSANYAAALRDWKKIDETPQGEAVTGLEYPPNKDLYMKLKNVVERRVEKTKALRNLFYDKQLRFKGIDKLDSKVPGGDDKKWHDFKLHLYLTEGLGKSMEFMVEVSLTTNLMLAFSALVVGLLAYLFQVAFMYIMPLFTVMFFGFFAAGFFMSKRYIALAEDTKYDTYPDDPDSESELREDDGAQSPEAVNRTPVVVRPSLKAPFGFKVGEKVAWAGKDNPNVPEGSCGIVQGFTDDAVKVNFPKGAQPGYATGTWTLSPTKLMKVRPDLVTVHSYCRAVQVILYCIFFSFSRLLLSQDIFMFYPKVYISACLALAATFVMLRFFGGQLMKEATCALILVPHVAHFDFKKHLEQIVSWHVQVNCHECGVTQLDYKRSHTAAWAGRSSGAAQGNSRGCASERGSMFSFR